MVVLELHGSGGHIFADVTDEQAKNGHGRDMQSEVLNKYCEIKKIKIAKETDFILIILVFLFFLNIIFFNSIKHIYVFVRKT